MLREIYLLLKKHLAENVASLKHIDWYLNQFQQDDEDHILITTGCFIRFLPITWTTLANNVQRAVLQFEIHLTNETAYGDDRDMTDTTYINHLAQEGEIFKSLMNQRFKLSDLVSNPIQDKVLVESIIRTGSTVHEEIDNIIRTSQSFQCTVFDYTATPLWKEVMAQLVTVITNE